MHVGAGQLAWIQGGAGGVGGFAIQICRGLGATVITTASERNRDFVASLGASHCIHYDKEDVVTEIMKITEDRGVDAVAGTVDAASADQGVKVLAYRGGIACVSGLPTLNPETFAGAHSIHAVSLGLAHQSRNRAAQIDLAKMGQEMIGLVAGGQINPMVEQVIRFEEIPAGLAQLQTRHVRGKIVAEIS